MIRKYANKGLGKLIQDHIGHGSGDSLEAAVKLARKLHLSDTTCFAVVNGLMSGHFFGNFSRISKTSKLSFKNHALRLSHYLHALEVPEDHEIINLSRKTLGSDFVYPPDLEFPYTRKI